MIKTWEVWARVGLGDFLYKGNVQCYSVKVQAESLMEVEGKALNAFREKNPKATYIDIYYADGRL